MRNFIPPIVLFVAVVSNVSGAVYTDNFLTGAGPLNGRTTAPEFGNWISVADLSVAPGAGIYESGTAAFPTASFAMPTLDPSSIVSVSLTMRPTGTSGNFIAFGFTNQPLEFVTSQGSGLAFLSGSGATDDGLVAVSSGFSLAGDNVYYQDPFTLFNGNISTTLNLEYTVASGLLNVSATNGAETVTVYNGLTGWTPTPGPGADNPIPYQTYLQYFTVQFQDQTTGLVGGNISGLSVSVVPEPSTASYILGAAGMVVAIGMVRRRRSSAS